MEIIFLVLKITILMLFQITGQASSENAKAVGMLAETMAQTGWNLACTQTGSNSKGVSVGGVKAGDASKRMYSTFTPVTGSGNYIYVILLRDSMTKRKALTTTVLTGTNIN